MRQLTEEEVEQFHAALGESVTLDVVLADHIRAREDAVTLGKGLRERVDACCPKDVVEPCRLCRASLLLLNGVGS